MKTRLLSALLLACVGSAGAAEPAGASPDLAGYAAFSGVIVGSDDFDTTGGVALAVGARWRESHFFGIQLLHFRPDWVWNERTITPVLATYEYRAPVSERLTAHLGLAAGVASEKYETTFFSAGVFSHHSTSTTALSYGANAGLAYRLTARLSLVGDLQVLRTENGVHDEGHTFVLGKFGVSCGF